MAELLLSAFLQVLFDRLASRELLNFARRKKLHSLLKRWETTLKDIHIVLEDVEDQAMARESRVTPWLDDLRDLAYDVENLLDEFATEEALRALSMPSNKASASSTSSKVRDAIIHSYSASFLSPRRFTFDRQMRSKVEEIDKRLAEIMSRKKTLGLREGGGSRIYGNGTCGKRRLPSTSLVEAFIVGREDDRKAILNLSVYNDETVKGSFPVRAWACVSVELDEVAITRTILQSVGGAHAHEGKDLNALQVELQRSLAGKKFLIVLDDLWNEKYDRWTLLRRPFESCGAKGSKIIVTTRSKSIASTVKTGTGIIYPLSTLCRDDCLALLAYHALGVDNFDNHPHLKPEGEKMVEKCGGLPLAAKTLGGLLRSNYNLNEWIAIADSKIWDLPEDINGVPQALNLSYIYLPPDLKRCFVYCAVFPKNHEFDRDDLISLWMAEGLLGRPQPEGSMRGLKCFHELLNRSFFQPSSRGISLFVMHDLLNDLAASIASESCLSLGEGQLYSCKQKICLEKVRHLSLIPHFYEVSARFEGFCSLRRLRTFLALESNPYNYMAENVIDDVLRNQKHLRVLSLCGYQIREVPNCIGSLRHLRYLNLLKSHIECLPSSLSTLYNLETLILRECYNLVELPGWINKLINLRCVDILKTRFRKMPAGIGDLCKLEILPIFVVGDSGARLKELKDLQCLRGELTIHSLCDLANVEDARDAALNAKPGLTSLILRWNQAKGPASARDVASQMQVLDWLQPQTKIKNIEIEGYGGTKFPFWIGDPSFVKLERVTLRDCLQAETLPSLGWLPLLKEVKVKGMSAVCIVGPEFYGNIARPFPSLETLAFVDMFAWERWSFLTGSEHENNSFPQLHELRLQNCPKLIGRWPSQFPALMKIKIQRCPLLETPVNLPSLEEGWFGYCDGRVLRGVISICPLTCLTMVKIVRISELTFLQGGSLCSLTSLQDLHIEKCHELMCLWEDKEGCAAGIGSSHALKRLTVKDCHRLAKIGRFPSNLEYLCLAFCDNLEELPNNMQGYGTSLKELRILWCSKIMSLPKGMMMCNLTELEIRHCPSLRSFSGAKLPCTLRSLKVRDCEKLQSLPKGIATAPNRDNDSSSSSNGCWNGVNSRAMWSQPTQLQELVIAWCPSLLPLFDGNVKFVPSLKKLYIERSEILGSSLEGIAVCHEPDSSLSIEEIRITDCKMIKRLSQNLHRFAHLTELHLRNCPALELECFPHIPDSLRRLSLDRCPGIKSLRHQMHALRRSLRELKIVHCPGIASFPEEGLPPNLEVLEVSNCENLYQPMSKWGLQQATALWRLEIDGKIGCLEGNSSFPPQDEGGWHVLPPSLTHLKIQDQHTLVTLSSGLQNHLTSLQGLSIYRCPKLKCLPREGFPASLGSLYIEGCTEILKKRCNPLIDGIPARSQTGNDIIDKTRPSISILINWLEFFFISIIDELTITSSEEHGMNADARGRKWTGKLFVILKRKDSGLGVRDIRVWNKACILRFIWMLVKEAESLWIAWVVAYLIKVWPDLSVPWDCIVSTSFRSIGFKG
ncbi:hypothetical protein CRG98_031774 [Punica granatum]|uniref:Disease resistance RPP13-like protein 1 n=1 Tax=Punica granatum TaxID=22663 RepID=A0A2I0IVN1_PUNGR|nr:hypothetical protein CRG98_031774 [Punica granatum]